MREFIGRPIAPTGAELFTPATGSEPPLPRAFLWDGRTLVVTAVLRKWRSSRTDRGDLYLKRHWFELQTECGLKAEVYYDRESRRGRPKWWLYAVEALSERRGT
jgi:hypothetical protein